MTGYTTIFGSIIYNTIAQNFIQVVVHVIIIDQCYQIQVTVIYSRCDVRVLFDRELSAKPGLGHLE